MVLLLHSQILTILNLLLCHTLLLLHLYLNIHINFCMALNVFYDYKEPEEGKLTFIDKIKNFFAGLINDVVMGIPLGLSSISYLIISLTATYVKNMTVNTRITTDWFTFFIAIFFSNLIFFILLSNFSEITISLTEISYNTFFTLIFFPFFWFLFNLYNSIITPGRNA